MIKVKLASLRNVNHNQTSYVLYGVKDHFLLCEDITVAQRACLQFIKRYNLDGGSWIGGEVYELKGEYLGRISYHGYFSSL